MKKEGAKLLDSKTAPKHYIVDTLVALANLAPDAGRLLAEVRRAEDEAAQVNHEWANFTASRPGGPSFDELCDRFARVSDQLEAIRGDLIAPFWETALAAFPAAPFASKLWGYTGTTKVVVIPTRRNDGLPVMFNNPQRLLEAVAALVTTLRRLASEVAAPPSSGPVELPITVAPPRYQIMPNGSAAFGPDLFLDVVIPAIGEAGADLRRVKLCTVCIRLFFARRHDSLACSQKCANLQRVRRFRHKQSQYAENHRKNRKAKQARAALHARALVKGR